MQSYTTGMVIHDHRLRYAWSVDMLVGKLRVGARSVRRWEADEVFPGPYAICQLCDVFQLTPPDFFSTVPPHSWAALPTEQPERSLEVHSEQKYRALGVRLKHERLWLALSQEELAGKVGTCRLSIARWEKGLVLPQPIYQQRLCNVFGKAWPELFPEYLDQRPPLFSQQRSPLPCYFDASDTLTVFTS
jgi:transcriptional regulator with XRE-family HTH domain